ncbi:MAG: hypothetical protein ABH873_01885 [Candidatus Firestonebacteria bacterium]
MNKNNGYITIMVIWVAAILIVLSSGLVIYVSFQQRALKNYIKTVKASYIAKTGLNDVMFDFFSELKSKLNEGDITLSEINNMYQNIPFADGVYSAIIEDEKSKANINTASNLLYRNIMNLLEIDDSDRKAESILVWRREHGAFATVEELGLISDLDTNDCFKLIPYWTTYSLGTPGSCSINVNTASRIILKAHLDEFKAVPGTEEKLIKKRPFKSLEAMEKYLRKISPNLSENMVGYFTTSEPVHRVYVTGSLEGKYISKINAVFSLWLRKHELICLHYFWQE